MFPLLFPFLTDTVIAPPYDYQDIFVNEWGVVVYTSEGTTLAGAPDENGDVYFGREVYGPLLVDAPVIWIHGAFFTEATLTVRANQGWLSTIYPDARTEAGEDMPVTASWDISAPPPTPMTARPEPPDAEGVPFAWAMDLWRAVPSRDLYSERTGEYLGNFLYYEAGIPYWQPPDDAWDPMLLAGHYATDGLRITTGATPVVERVRLVPLPGGSGGEGERNPLEDDEVLSIICGWAGGNLKSQEIDALWGTWKPFFQTDEPTDRLSDSEGSPGSDEVWILFPLPPAEVEKISSIELQFSSRIPGVVTYNRLFLGLVRVR